MTKKDYVKLAKAISSTSHKDVEENYQILTKEPFVNRLCDILEEDNPRFDREQFITACQ